MNRRDLLKGLGWRGRGRADRSVLAAAIDARPPTALRAAGGAAATRARRRRSSAPADRRRDRVARWLSPSGARFTGHNADVQQQLVDRFNQSQKDVKVTLREPERLRRRSRPN